MKIIKEAIKGLIFIIGFCIFIGTVALIFPNQSSIETLFIAFIFMWLGGN
jgi:hypothetical protein